MVIIAKSSSKNAEVDKLCSSDNLERLVSHFIYSAIVIIVTFNSSLKRVIQH